MNEKKLDKNILVVGGSSGLGLELARKYRDMGATVHVTGARDEFLFTEKGMTYHKFKIDHDGNALIRQVDKLRNSLPEIHTLVYSAGFYQPGHVENTVDHDVLRMNNVNMNAPHLLVKNLKVRLGKEKKLKVIIIASTSARKAREFEPFYSSGMAGRLMFGRCIGPDYGLGKVMVASPAGMDTPFWDHDKGRDVSTYLYPTWVAEQIIEQSRRTFKYLDIELERNPARIVEHELLPYTPLK